MKIYLVKGPKEIYYARMLQPNEKWTMRSLKTSNETEARVRLGELSYQLKQKGWEVPKITESPALKDLILSYIAHISRRKAVSWADKKRQYLTGCVIDFFGADTKVSAISPGRVEAYANDRCESIRGVTVNRELSCLRSFFKWCKRQAYVAVNPAAQIEFMDDEVQIVRRFLSPSISSGFAIPESALAKASTRSGPTPRTAVCSSGPSPSTSSGSRATKSARFRSARPPCMPWVKCGRSARPARTSSSGSTVASVTCRPRSRG